MATDAELNSMTNQDKLDRINRGDAANHYRAHGKSVENRLRDTEANTSKLLDIGASLPDAILDAPIKDAATGNMTTPRRKFEYLFHEQRKVDRLLAEVISLKAITANLSGAVVALADGEDFDQQKLLDGVRATVADATAAIEETVTAAVLSAIADADISEAVRAGLVESIASVTTTTSAQIKEVQP